MALQLPLDIKKFKNSHDHFIIIDNKTVYHFGASLKDLGEKIFADAQIYSHYIFIKYILLKIRAGINHGNL